MMQVGEKSGGNLSVDVGCSFVLGWCIWLDETCAD